MCRVYEWTVLVLQHDLLKPDLIRHVSGSNPLVTLNSSSCRTCGLEQWEQHWKLLNRKMVAFHSYLLQILLTPEGGTDSKHPSKSQPKQYICNMMLKKKLLPSSVQGPVSAGLWWFYSQPLRSYVRVRTTKIVVSGKN